MSETLQDREYNTDLHRDRLKSLFAVVSCVSIAGVSMGLTLPLMTISMARDGASDGMIGLIGSVLGFATVCYSRFVPAGIKFCGMRNYVLICMLTEALMFLCLKIFPSPLAWIIIRFIMGMMVAGIFIASETWINYLARDDTRGRVLALFNISLGVGFASGPLILIVAGSSGWAPFLSGCIITLIALLPLLFINNFHMDLEKPSTFSPFAFILIAPALCAAVVLTAGTETIMGTFFIGYGKELGHSESDTEIMLTIFFIGGLFFQYPVGWLADHINPRKLLLYLGISCLICIFLLYGFAPHKFVLKVLLFCWGGLLTSLYNTALTAVGHDYSGSDLVAANASFGFLWGIGSLAPLITGQIMEFLGSDALIMVTALLTFAFILLMAGSLKRRC
ncbi:MFS transporter [Kiloniella laminariae]|uniref:MFS transporter n=1 Tax=Kiloniella laminariae TaxID=454162 RepID=UPI00036CC88A|nr:MFS transporter [Kiloniella laminariae]